jgi:hypothetical protein
MKYSTLTSQQRKGFDLIVDVLNKKYPFIVGWDQYDGWEVYTANLYLTLVVDLTKYQEYFNTRIYKYLDLKSRGYSLITPAGNMTDVDRIMDVGLKIDQTMENIYPYLPQEYIVRYPGIISDVFLAMNLKLGDYLFVNPPKMET